MASNVRSWMAMRSRQIIALATAVLALAAAACSDPAPQDPTPVKTFKITPAARTETVPTAAATPSATSGAPSATDVIEITAAGQTLKFDKDAITARAGAVTIHFNNKDTAVVHNLHLHKGTDAKGESAGQTDLEAGPTEQELKVDVTAGHYYYQCDAHPTTMKGILTVQ